MTAPSPAPAVHAMSLAKRFGGRVAVAGVDLTLDAGECLALFGPNGAGKTTLLRLVAGLLRPSAGSVRVQGVDVRRDARARSHVGLISHHNMLYAPLTALENVEFTARLYGLSDPGAAARRALESMRVSDRAQAPGHSRGSGQERGSGSLRERQPNHRRVREFERPGRPLLDRPVRRGDHVRR